MDAKRKASLRVEILERRDSLSYDELRASSGKVMENLWGCREYEEAETIFYFVNFRSEVETIGGIKRALSEGKRVAVPYCVLDERILRFVEIRDFEKDLMVDAYNILEPVPAIRKSRVIPVDEAGHVLFPGSVFDVRGGRMGYGAGYYDKTFAEVSDTTFIGLAFDFQVLAPDEYVPMESHDLPVDKIVTEKRVIECKYPK